MANYNNNKKSNFYKVKNRSASSVVYNIPDQNIRREFAPGEEKKIPFSELEALTFQPGGRELLAGFLQLTADDIIERLSIPTEEEYYLTEEQIIDLLKNGSHDAFLDCLDFAPVGVIDLIKRFSVSLPLTDTRKIHALKEKTGFDVEAALKNMASDKEDESVEEESAPAAAKTTGKTGRRTTPSYKIVNKTAE